MAQLSRREHGFAFSERVQQGCCTRAHMDVFTAILRKQTRDRAVAVEILGDVAISDEGGFGGIGFVAVGG